MKVECPVCKGSGELKSRPASKRKEAAEERRGMARALRDKGYSFRQIGGMLGWKSSRSAFVACGKVVEK